MKAALNGAANLSIRDGWWDEWYDPAYGWEIPSADGVDDPDRRDDLEARTLYDIIENEIVPRFYDVDGDGLPQRWIQMIRDTVAGLGPKVLASRMVRDYVTKLYAPSAASSRAIDAAPGGVAALAAWKARVRAAWPGVVVDHVESLDGDQVELGAKIHVSALVRLGELSPDDIEVQLVTGRVDPDDQLTEPRINPFPTGADVDPSTGSGQVPSTGSGQAPSTGSEQVPSTGSGQAPSTGPGQAPSTGSGHGLRRYEGSVETKRAGELGYTVRVVPFHPQLASDAEMGLAALPPDAAPPPSAGQHH
jgi:starch phosphorylase